jgi:cytochrome c
MVGVRAALVLLVGLVALGGCGLRAGGAGRPAVGGVHPVTSQARRLLGTRAETARRTAPRRGRHDAAPTVSPRRAAQGAALFRSAACDSCHGPAGQGSSAAPALDGSGPTPVLANPATNSPQKLATFIRRNMPLNHPGILTRDQAASLAAYVYYTLNHRSGG